ncbi:MAG: rod shape-determining protein MreC [Clostridia bacterium]|nr:rod shape-determining protein MreC [Clostridia bacterium]
MSNRLKKIITAVIIAVLILIIALTPLKNIVISIGGTIVSPVCSLFNGISSSVSGWFSYMGEAGNVHDTNKELLKEIDELKIKLQSYQGIEQENIRLEELLEIKSNYQDIESTGAEIIARDSSNWFTVFTINKGSKDGIAKNQPVVCGGGLVGHTTDVGSNWAKVVTIIDTAHSVSGMSLRSNDYVQIDGDLTLMGGGLCKMTNITENGDVIVGDVLVTSGIGGVYPKGIVIGTVSEFKNLDSGTGSYAIVKPSVDFQRINELLVLKTVPVKE